MHGVAIPVMVALGSFTLGGGGQMSGGTASVSMDDQSGLTIDDLCAAAETRARSLGHALDAWEDVGGEQYLARATTCSACGEAAYVRIEEGMHGIAGGACSQPCPGS